MAKPELEFFAPDHIPWQPVAGSTTGGAGGPGVEQKILALDQETGDVTRLLRFAAGVETKETITHDFWEEVWILSGELIDIGKGKTFTAGMYACRPPGMVHGPYRVPRGCTRSSSATGRRRGHDCAILCIGRFEGIGKDGQDPSSACGFRPTRGRTTRGPRRAFGRTSRRSRTRS